MKDASAILDTHFCTLLKLWFSNKLVEGTVLSFKPDKQGVNFKEVTEIVGELTCTEDD